MDGTAKVIVLGVLAAMLAGCATLATLTPTLAPAPPASLPPGAPLEAQLRQRLVGRWDGRVDLTFSDATLMIDGVRLLLVDEIAQLLVDDTILAAEAASVMADIRPKLDDLWNAILADEPVKIHLAKPKDPAFRVEMSFLSRAAARWQQAVAASVALKK